MELNQFFDRIEMADDLEGVGISKNGIVIRHKPTTISVCFPAGAVKMADWETLYDIMSHKREPMVLQHITRVVGYYSKIENWNKSKLGELEDRHGGSYGLGDD